MNSSAGRILAPILSLVLAALVAAVPARALTRLEGRLGGGAKLDGAYDFIIHVRGKLHADDKDKLILSIHIPKVAVVGGGFDILLNLGLEPLVESSLSFQVEGRRFESLAPFQPAEVSRVLSGTRALQPSSGLAYH